jgi:hypothetical protein
MTQAHYLALIGKCIACDETGCWNWQAAFTTRSRAVPLFHFPGSRQNRRTMAAYKAAWLLSGREVPAGHWVYRKCLNHRCVNPEHCATGTPKELGAFIAALGTRKNVTRRVAANMRNGAKSATPLDVVRKIEAMLADGRLRAEIAAEVGVSKDTVTAVRHKRHPHSSDAVRVVRGASVFAQ